MSSHDDNILKLYSLFASTISNPMKTNPMKTNPIKTNPIKTNLMKRNPVKTDSLEPDISTVPTTHKKSKSESESEFHKATMKLKKKRILDIRKRVDQSIYFDIVMSSLVMTTGIVCYFVSFKFTLPSIKKILFSKI